MLILQTYKLAQLSHKLSHKLSQLIRTHSRDSLGKCRTKLSFSQLEQLYRNRQHFVTVLKPKPAVLCKNSHNNTKQAGQSCRILDKGKQGRCRFLDCTVTGFCRVLHYTRSLLWSEIKKVQYSKQGHQLYATLCWAKKV